MTESRTFCPVVATLNLKGGVGKTTISANLMRTIFLQRKKVLLVDLDPQFNLTQALLKKEAYQRLIDEEKTINYVMDPKYRVSLYDVAPSRPHLPDLSDVIHGLKHIRGAQDTRLDLIPGDFRLVKYSLIRNHHALDAAFNRFEAFIDRCREIYDLVCIDCNPSSSFITSSAIRVSSHLLIPVRPDKYSVLGVELLADFLGDLHELKKRPELHILLNGVPRNATSSPVENALRAHSRFGSRVLATPIYQSDLLASRSDHTGFATERRVAHVTALENNLEDVALELMPRLGM